MARFVPIFAAVSLGLCAFTAHGQTSQAVTDLNNQLYLFAQQESTTAVTATTPPAQDLLNNFDPNNPTTGAVKTAPTTLTAAQADLVYAVYSVLLANPGNAYSTPTQVGGLAAAALQAQTVGTKLVGRADLSTLGPRVLNAALLATGGQDSAASTSAIYSQLIAVNTGNKYALTEAEVEALAAQALKSAGQPVSGIGAAILNDSLGHIPAATTKITADQQLQTFAIGVLKLVGTGASQVANFTTAVLANTSTAVTGTTTAEITYTKAIADGISTVPAAVGAVYQALAAQLNNNTTIETTLFQDTHLGALHDVKLAKDLSAIVADVANSGGYSASPATLAARLAAGQSLANQEQIVAGAVYALGATTQSQVNTLLTGVIAANPDSGTTKAFAITPTNAATFAGAASVGTGNSAADIAVFFASLPGSSGTVAYQTTVAQDVLKAIAVSSPTSATLIASQLIAANTANFGTSTAQQALAVSLAKTLPTNGAVTASAVLGVAQTFVNGPAGGGASTDADNQAAALGAATIKVATASAFNIAYALASLQNVTSVNHLDFATQLATLEPTYAPTITAGVAAYDPANSVAITTGVINSSAALQAKALTIAASVATTSDLEHLALIAQGVAGLLQPSTSTSKLPKITSLSALTISFAKAINTRSLPDLSGLSANTVSGLAIATNERTNQLGELAAGLTQAVLNNFAADPKLSSYLATIGTSIMSSLAAKQTLNAGVNAADLQDAAQAVAGAIAQTISLDTSLGSLRATLLETSTSGSLLATLVKAAKTWGASVTAAFNQVDHNSTGAAGGTNPAAGSEIGMVYQDPKSSNNITILQVVNGVTKGRYNDGAFVEPESANGNVFGPIL